MQLNLNTALCKLCRRFIITLQTPALRTKGDKESMFKYLVRHSDAIEAVACPCGASTRIVTFRDTALFNLHRTQITQSKTHYHKTITEVYYILEGDAQMTLDSETVGVRTGTTIVIPPGVRHQITGHVTALILGLPAWDEQDEHFD